MYVYVNVSLLHEQTHQHNPHERYQSCFLTLNFVCINKHPLKQFLHSLRLGMQEDLEEMRREEEEMKRRKAKKLKRH